MTSGWQEKRYDVASITNTMGIGTKLDWQNDDEIELRLANKFQKITLKALNQKQEMPQIDDSTIGVILNVKAE